MKKPKNFSLSHNAALSGEQRRPLYLKYCAVNTKTEANQKCQALGIRLERFVSLRAKVTQRLLIAHFKTIIHV